MSEITEYWEKVWSELNGRRTNEWRLWDAMIKIYFKCDDALDELKYLDPEIMPFAIGYFVQEIMDIALAARPDVYFDD